MHVLQEIMVLLGMLVAAFCVPCYLIALLPEPDAPTIYGPAGQWCRENRRALLVWGIGGVGAMLAGAALGSS